LRRSRRSGELYRRAVVCECAIGYRVPLVPYMVSLVNSVGGLEEDS